MFYKNILDKCFFISRMSDYEILPP